MGTGAAKRLRKMGRAIMAGMPEEYSEASLYIRNNRGEVRLSPRCQRYWQKKLKQRNSRNVTLR